MFLKISVAPVFWLKFLTHMNMTKTTKNSFDTMQKNSNLFLLKKQSASTVLGRNQKCSKRTKPKMVFILCISSISIPFHPFSFTYFIHFHSHLVIVKRFWGKKPKTLQLKVIEFLYTSLISKQLVKIKRIYKNF